MEISPTHDTRVRRRPRVVRDVPGRRQVGGDALPAAEDAATQPTDPYLLNTRVNSRAKVSLVQLLRSHGVRIAFSGHAHTYQRIVPHSSRQLISYVTGGGGVLEPALSGRTCRARLPNLSIYALGWSNNRVRAGAGTGSFCGPAVNRGSAAAAAARPRSPAQVYEFLKVTVRGRAVTLTPINAAGHAFDRRTYHV